MSQGFGAALSAKLFFADLGNSFSFGATSQSFRPTSCPSQVTGVGGAVEGLAAIVGDRADLHPDSARQVVRKRDVAKSNSQM